MLQSIGSKFTRAQIAFFRIVLVYMMPMLLVFWGIVPFKWHIPLMLFVVLFVFYFVNIDKPSKESLGMVKPSGWKDYAIYGAFIILGVLAIIFFANELGYHPMDKWYLHPTFLYLFIPVSVLQEFAYRSVLFPELHHIFNEDAQVIFANAGIFTILHIMYSSPHVILPLTMIGGLAFATLWKIKPNFYLISLAHIVLNFVAVLYGFFSVPSA